jgi:hypothetical protein
MSRQNRQGSSRRCHETWAADGAGGFPHTSARAHPPRHCSCERLAGRAPGRPPG